MAGLTQAVLLFGADEEARAAAESLGLPVLRVLPPQYRTPLAVLLGKRASAPNAVPYTGDPLPDSIAVFHGLTGRRLDRALEALRGKVALRAVTTPMNLQWNALLLWRNLAAERAALEKRKK
ncbi:MAG: DUF3783 domain-containing protein [bacterium]